MNIPDKWYVIRNSINYKVLNKWLNGSAHRDNHSVFFVENRKREYRPYIPTGYTEITFEQFEKYILNEYKESNYLIFN